LQCTQNAAGDKKPGVPTHADQWAWSIGFYPAMEPGTQRSGTTAIFEAAREAFEAAWTELLPTIPSAAFAEWRHNRNRRAEMKATRDSAEKLDSEISSTMMAASAARYSTAGIQPKATRTAGTFASPTRQER
jgi:hypothetical protein